MRRIVKTDNEYGNYYHMEFLLGVWRIGIWHTFCWSWANIGFNSISGENIVSCMAAYKRWQLPKKITEVVWEEGE